MRSGNRPVEEPESEPYLGYTVLHSDSKPPVEGTEGDRQLGSATGLSGHGKKVQQKERSGQMSSDRYHKESRTVPETANEEVTVLSANKQRFFQ